jgi:DNA-binding transcriptional ArsR family regulator
MDHTRTALPRPTTGSTSRPGRPGRRTGQVGADRGLSEAALSKQLRTLTEVGVLQPRRDGYYVLYSLVEQPIATLSTNLLAFLEASRVSE